MIARAEELLGKVLLVLAFSALAAAKLSALIARGRVPGALWNLHLAVDLLSLTVVLMMVVMTVRRLPPIRSAAGIMPRLAAFTGTFLLMLLVWLPPGRPPAAAEAVATAMLSVGAAGTVYCLRYLGRSFSILASARQLVTSGPYNVVRHPLYVAEAVSTIGIVVAHWSAAAVVVGALQCAVQWRRIRYEEQVLRRSFPDYDAYARRVPMLVPRMSPGGVRADRAPASLDQRH